MKNYFDKPRNSWRKYVVDSNPSKIYNTNESSMTLEHHPPKMIAVKEQKVYSMKSGSKSQVTMTV